MRLRENLAAEKGDFPQEGRQFRHIVGGHCGKKGVSELHRPILRDRERLDLYCDAARICTDIRRKYHPRWRVRPRADCPCLARRRADGQ
jgi:hypothetical protein